MFYVAPLLLTSALFVPPKTPTTSSAITLQDELRLYPSEEVCRIWITFGEDHQQWIERKLSANLVCPSDRALWVEYLTIMRQRLRWWQELLWIRSGEADWSVAYRSHLLRELQVEMLPHYPLGYLPPPVEVSMLVRID